ncbi:MAG: NAD(+)/NADH kinase [Bacteroidales bacterium]|nr:NAD(+)/NADH kinase [Bacteroidales bacterium]
MKVAIFGRTVYRASLPRLMEVLDIVEKSSCEAYFYEPFYRYLAELSPSFSFVPSGFFSSRDDIPEDTGLLLSLGGDGTFLSSVPLVVGKKIPVAGINFGRLGFLTTSKIEGIASLLRGEFRIEKRTLLKMDCKSMPEDFCPYALNEFSVQRKGPAVLELEIKVDGEPIPRYMADGVLVASATGSTAYSMSAGGPIVMPGCRVLIIVPVAPHNLNIRPLVVSDTATIEVSFSTRYKDATLSADNRSFSIPDGETAVFTASSTELEIVSPDNGFMEALSRKLFWGADWRNSI